MKLPVLVFAMIFSSGLLLAQNSNWTHTDFTIQPRLLQNPSNLGTVLDLSLGTEWNYKIRNRLSLNLGTSLNYGHFKSPKVDSEEVFFISYFKGTRIDYFNHEEVSQLSLETPISLELDLFGSESNKFSLVGGVIPQFLLYSNSTGVGLDGDRKVATSIFNGDLTFNKDKGNLDGLSHYLINDLNLNVGFNVEHEIDHQKAIILGTGFQYSTKGKSSGLYLKTGFRF